MRIIFRSLVITFAMTCLGACGFVGFPGVYKINVEQGNIVTQEMVDQLKPGMSRRQVRFILGTPLLDDPFNQHRWDYVYVKRNGQDVLDEAHVQVVFNGDKLEHIEGDYQPEWAAPDDTTTADTSSETTS